MNYHPTDKNKTYVKNVINALIVSKAFSLEVIIFFFLVFNPRHDIKIRLPFEILESFHIVLFVNIFNALIEFWC